MLKTLYDVIKQYTTLLPLKFSHIVLTDTRGPFVVDAPFFHFCPSAPSSGGIAELQCKYLSRCVIYRIYLLSVNVWLSVRDNADVRT